MAKKDIHSFLNEIDNLDTFRKIVRSIYMYGADSAIDMINSNTLGIQKRTLDDYIKRLSNYMNAHEFDDENHLTFHNIPNRSNDKRSRYFVRDPYRCSYNFLASIYRQHTINAADLFVYFYLLSLLTTITNDDIQEKFENTPIIVSPFSADNFSVEMEELFQYVAKTDKVNVYLNDNRKKVHLDKLVDLGILCKDNKTESLYSIAKDIFCAEAFDFPENDIYFDILQSFQQMASFFCNYSAISIPGYFLADHILQILNAEFCFANEASSEYRNKTEGIPYFYENARFQNILDDDVTWQVLQAIHKNDVISYTYQTAESVPTQNTILLPIKIVEDKLYGRHYVFGWKYQKKHNYRSGEFVLHRIDRIFNISINTTIPEESKYCFINKEQNTTIAYHELNECYQQWMSHAWNVIGGFAKPQKVLIHFCFDDKYRGRTLLSELLRHSNKGSITCVDREKLKYDFEIEVSNPDELIPWINGFGDMAIVDKDINPAFAEQMRNYNMEVLSLYESV